jgi:hypothetical protein
MDIFYHSPGFEKSINSGGIGSICATGTKLVELASRLPKRIWVFATPKGQRGSIQLIASVLVTEAPTVAVQADQLNPVFYDVFSQESVFYTDSATSDRVEQISALFKYNWHAAFSVNFRGDAALQAMEANSVRAVQAMVADWEKIQLLERVRDKVSVQPINPFAHSR